jgi:cytidylate kinase
MNQVPIQIIAIDGTSSSGKGTVAYKIAEYFGFHYLNSGALYRLVAHIAITKRIPLDHEEALVSIAQGLSVTFKGKQVIYEGVDVWPIIKGEENGKHASIVSRIVAVRDALLDKQRSMAQTPGLVAEGRDMCTRVFTHAQIKIYLDADVTIRARRRLGEEIAAGNPASLEAMVNEIRERDHKDMNKDVGRLYPAQDAILVDNSNMTKEETLHTCIAWCKQKGITSVKKAI